MAAMIMDPVVRADEPAIIAELTRDWQTADGYDLDGLDLRPLTESQVAADRSGADAVVVARAGHRIRGYGWLISWSETDGTLVQLLDTRSAPGSDRTATDTALLTHLEHRAVERNAGHRPSVLGANAEVQDRDRVALLAELGYRVQLEMVELELRTPLAGGPLPEEVTIRTAGSADAAAITRLTELNWAGRPYFGGLSLEQTRSWLAKADPALFLLAEAGGELVGLAVAAVGIGFVEIEDVGVHPHWRRHGLATGLLTELVARIRDRSTLGIRLLTEGDDPAGARRLYERLGFVTVARHGRYRKALG